MIKVFGVTNGIAGVVGPEVGDEGGAGKVVHAVHALVTGGEGGGGWRTTGKRMS